jgi:hypothetical protein
LPYSPKLLKLDYWGDLDIDAIMALCSMCQAIPHNVFLDPSLTNWSTFFVHHLSFQNLQSAAEEGCNVCSILYNTINPTRSLKEYPCEEVPGPADRYLGSPENLASKDAERPSFHVEQYYDKKSRYTETWLFYHLGKHGYGYKFDIEYSGELPYL